MTPSRLYEEMVMDGSNLVLTCEVSTAVVSQWENSFPAFPLFPSSPWALDGEQRCSFGHKHCTTIICSTLTTYVFSPDALLPCESQNLYFVLISFLQSVYIIYSKTVIKFPFHIVIQLFLTIKSAVTLNLVLNFYAFILKDIIENLK